ncbi:hypothetical protein FVO59_03040 [Microbacterium esteraromaticum]|uniref:Uncharacterized protein n=1 Tax=Microbacterium esteraromaticum TaxID=57043 RepID=A0A7D7W5N0_9MICO|nr:hypothetical protein [Microbacterium esteraromaticum]QMU96296.1 hypothetical protein FVO59_03040 [Microbacterium esteraromaticum]
MTAVADEIVAARAAANARLARLRARQRREQERFDARVLDILRGRIRSDALAAIEAEARRQLDAERARRSERARAARKAHGAGQEGRP